MAKFMLDRLLTDTVCELRESFLVAQTVTTLSAMQQIRVQSLSREDPLEMGMATHSRILAWENPWTEQPGRASLVAQR